MSELGQNRKSSVGLGMSAFRGKAEEIGVIADIETRRLYLPNRPGFLGARGWGAEYSRAPDRSGPHAQLVKY